MGCALAGRCSQPHYYPLWASSFDFRDGVLLEVEYRSGQCRTGLPGGQDFAYVFHGPAPPEATIGT